MATAAARKAILPLAGWAYARKVSEYRFTFAPEGRPSFAGSPWWLNDTVGRAMVFGPVIHLQPNFMKARLNAFAGRNPDPGRVLRRKNNAISASRRFVLASPNNV